MDSKDNEYYIVRKNALPEVLLKVVEVKRLLETDRTLSVSKTVDQVGISRSTFYKYKDTIMPFRENHQGRTITFMIIMQDQPGMLSGVLKKLADYDTSILTILQAIPINGVASLTISIDVLSPSVDVGEMVASIEHMDGIFELKLLSRE